MWGVQFRGGDSSDFYAHEIISYLDNYERPPPLIGRRISKNFHDAVHFGTVTSYDHESGSLEQIWGITYEDGDMEDLYMPELLESLCCDN